MMWKGKVPHEIVEVLYGANLTALGKKDGGVRRIAEGTTLRRLAAKVICKRFQKPIGEHLRPVQLGFGTKAGCEGIVHMVRQFYDQQTGTPKVVVKLDYKNASQYESQEQNPSGCLGPYPRIRTVYFSVL